MRRIVVTGGSGKAGRRVVTDLKEHGYEVRNVDSGASRDHDTSTVVADLTDLGQTFQALTEADAVVHLAAIPGPNVLSDDATFRINTLSTYNVFSAALALKLERVVWASSVTLIGVPFDREQPAYAPVDERHPSLAENHYALSKLIGEELAAQFSRWSGTPFVGLRYASIVEEHDYKGFPDFWDDFSIQRWDLWSYVDAQDVAQATRLALESDTSGSENFLVAAANTCMTTPSSELMAEVFPNVPIRNELGEFESLVSTDKARSMLGYEPQHSWRAYV